MIVSISQPAYLPWLGYFDRIALSDVHVVLDHVQYEKRGMTNRNKLRTKNGWMWVTVPILTKGKYFGGLAINSLAINNEEPWRRKHWNAIQANYRKADYFAEHETFFSSVYDTSWSTLLPLMTEITGYLLQAFNITTPLIRSSDLDPKSTKSDLILEICTALNATRYISGPFGREYLDLSAFQEAGIEVVFHDYRHPEYQQAQPEFEPFMSAIDLLLNHGPYSPDILLSPVTGLVSAHSAAGNP